MTKLMIGLCVATSIFQVLIAIGLLLISYSDGFGLAQIATNGETILEQMDKMEQNPIPQSSSAAQSTAGLLRPLLTSTNQAFQQLSSLLGWVGAYLLISGLLQLVALVILAQRISRS